MKPSSSTTSLPYGCWPSPVSTELLTAQAVRISEPQAAGDAVFWLETRPQEQGRNALVIHRQDVRQDVLPEPHSIRTRAHEYGGAPYLALADRIFCVLDADQQIYQIDLPSQHVQPITHQADCRYADFCYDAQRQQLIVVREDYAIDKHQPRNDIIAIDLSSNAIRVLASGADFYSNPRLNPANNQLSYLRWHHPHMPWDSTECVCATLTTEGNISSEIIVAGGNNESVFQPQWSPAGDLFFVSDRSNWWNIYRWDGETTHSVCVLAAEFATPQWVFGMSTYGFLNDSKILCCYSQQGRWQLATIDITQQKIHPVATEFGDISGLHCAIGAGYFLAASDAHSSRLFSYRDNNIIALTDSNPPISVDNISPATPITFTTHDHETAYGFFYAPKNSAITAPVNSLPPLLVMCHGGPTGATESTLNLKIQFWTSRGFAVLDVNYRGSTGFGRAYRDRLKKHWGITDVIDVCSGADYLVERNLVDKNRLAIRGSSAGGYTVLAALTFSDTFKAGASLYGIGDLAALAKDTHKFESHYLDSLIGPYPEAHDIYQARSPIHHIDQLNCPVIFLQGLQDKVVPPSQAETMFQALQNKGIVTDYITFAEEGHGFRQAHNIQRALDKELAFYQHAFGLKMQGNANE